jgi:hypothetical protein
MCYSAQIERDWRKYLVVVLGALMIAGCSSNVLLTPKPIDIGPEETIVTPQTRMSVENERAALHVHLADITKAEFGKIVMDRMNYPIAKFVHPSLCSADGSCVELHYAGISLGESDVEGIYRADWNHLDTHEFSSVRIRAEEAIKNVSLIWKASKQ